MKLTRIVTFGVAAAALATSAFAQRNPVVGARKCSNAAFAKLPAGTVEHLVKPENKAMLTKILTYHVVAGRVSKMELADLIRAGEGTATLNTVSGGKLWAMTRGADVVLKDEKGGMSTVTQTDVFQSNGVIHVIDTVVMPQ